MASLQGPDELTEVWLLSSLLFIIHYSIIGAGLARFEQGGLLRESSLFNFTLEIHFFFADRIWIYLGYIASCITITF